MADDLVHPDPLGRDAPDPSFVAQEIELVNGKIVRRETRLVPRKTQRLPPAHPPESPRDAVPERDKVHPKLRQMQRDLFPERRVQLLIVFTDQPKLPPFPRPIPGEPPDSPANLAEQARTRLLVQSIRQQRAASYQNLIARLVVIAPGLEVLDRFWLISGLLVEAPLAAVQPLADADFVLSIEPRYPGEPPPTTYQIDDGRTEIASNTYFDPALPMPRIALLDTGVFKQHNLLAQAGQIDMWRDCVNGGTDCNTGIGLNADDICGHGTASAAILVGNSSMGDDFRGVTDAVLDSFRIYHISPTGQCEVDMDAARRAIELVLEQAVGTVIVAEIQDSHDELSALSLQTDMAFGTGRMVVAANGNDFVTKKVRSPANAHCAIGVGAYQISTLSTNGDQCAGPTGDGRIKPDVQGPTGTCSAANTGVGDVAEYPGTSGATPYVAGGAALIWSRLDHANGFTEPGHVYVQLILFGRFNSPFTDAAAGAGPLELRANGTLHQIKLEVGHHEVADFPIVVASLAGRLAAAIWWPEDGPDGNVHNVIELRLIDPSGAERASGQSGKSVFERCSVGSVAAGTWQVRLHGVDVPKGPQTVYVAAFVRPNVISRLARNLRLGLSRIIRGAWSGRSAAWRWSRPVR